MSIEYIVFEKKSENDKPAWNVELVQQFCEDNKFDYIDIKDELLFCVARLTTDLNLTTDPTNPDSRYRLVELTPTISLVLKDDPSLDELFELEFPDVKKLDIHD